MRYAISEATTLEDALAELETELRALDAADPQQIDTTLVIFPRSPISSTTTMRCSLPTGWCGNCGSTACCRSRASIRTTGSRAAADDIENYTNRAPYPILHLLREDSIARAVDAFPDASAIYERNQETLRRLGHDGWREWMRRPSDDV